MSDDELLALEKTLWTGDGAVYERLTAAAALLVFPQPFGVMERDAAVRAVDAAPRWSAVEFSGVRIAWPTAHVAVIVYQVHASRGVGDPGFSGTCSSAWADDAGAWRLVLHQQTPTAHASGAPTHMPGHEV